MSNVEHYLEDQITELEQSVLRGKDCAMNYFPAASAIQRLADQYAENVCMVIQCEHAGFECDSPACDNHICGIHALKCPYCGMHFCRDCEQAHYESCGDRDPVLDVLIQQLPRA